MRKTAVTIVLVCSVCMGLPGFGQSDAGKVYQAKCVGCHGPGGKGSTMGLRLGAPDFHSPEVQGESDAQLTEAIAKGRGKMPAYEKSLKPDDINALVGYIRGLSKK